MILSGGFDPVHKGHVRMFKAAKEMAHKVILGINSDDWLVRKKGKSFMTEEERWEILSAFKYIDEVVTFDDADDTATSLLLKIKKLYPTSTIAFGNGGDRVIDNTPEKQFASAYDIDMVYNLGGEKIQSSSDLIKNNLN